jgi:uncharacterized protein YgiM (DUF1202 family)
MNRLSLALFCLVAFGLACSQPIPAAQPTATRTLPAPKPVITATATRLVAVVTAYQALHARQDHSNKALVLGYLYSGDTVTLTGRCSAGWAEIEFKDSTAWVSAKYLSNNKCKEKTK